MSPAFVHAFVFTTILHIMQNRSIVGDMVSQLVDPWVVDF